MGLERQTDVLDGLDRLAASGIHHATPAYRAGVVAPMVAAIGGAKGFVELLGALNGDLFHRMDASALETTLANGMAQSALIGRVAAEPRGRRK